MVKAFLNSNVTFVNKQKARNIFFPEALAKLDTAFLTGFLLGIRDEIPLLLLVALDPVPFENPLDGPQTHSQVSCN